ncbi:MAG: 23S rRNA (adenine(2503)-C(2))-methyltransferase RlmN [Spirochaetales bacterium]
MINTLLDYNIDELEKILTNLGEPKFRAKQLFEGLAQGKSIDEVATLPKELKETLKKEFVNETVVKIEEQKSADGTVKFLFELNDKNAIESVLMKYDYGYSVCVSTQVGCRMNCAFCASGIKGLVRNLSAGEILAQVIYINKYLGGKLGQDRKVTNVVLMGTGEPLDNYENVVKFIHLLNDKNGLNISTRNVSLSTSGLAPEIKRLADENLGITLTISLHSALGDIRQEIMPIAKKYNLRQIFDVCDYYYQKTGRRIVFEYLLIQDLTDTKEQVDELIKLFFNKPYHLNLIRLNEVKEKSLKASSNNRAMAFLNELKKAGISVTLRRKLGEDIDAACGQLRQKHINN